MEKDFSNIVQRIQYARNQAIRLVNVELINLYWNVGAHISKQVTASRWGEKTVSQLAKYIQKNYPELKGFDRRGLYRIKQFYETYSKLEFMPSTGTLLQGADN